MKKSKLIQKAKDYEELVKSLENKNYLFSKKKLENIHSKMENNFDKYMSSFEETLLLEMTIPQKEKYYIKLALYMRSL